ncbi:MAG: hypothetical protein GY838_18065 [bacterium]|nr:hypothetical protein [bacterium]
MRVVILWLLIATAAIAVEDQRPELIRFRIKDQNDVLYTDARYRNAPLLVFWGDREGIENLGDWSPVLCDSLASELRGYRLRAVDVAHTKGAPFFVKGMIKKRLRAEGNAPVLLDWDGAFAKAYDCRKDQANILLFDRTARLVRIWAVAESDPATKAEILVVVKETVAQRDPPDR